MTGVSYELDYKLATLYHHHAQSVYYTLLSQIII